jgi:hypothetical protein
MSTTNKALADPFRGTIIHYHIPPSVVNRPHSGVSPSRASPPGRRRQGEQGKQGVAGEATDRQIVRPFLVRRGKDVASKSGRAPGVYRSPSSSFRQSLQNEQLLPQSLYAYLLAARNIQYHNGPGGLFVVG